MQPAEPTSSPNPNDATDLIENNDRVLAVVRKHWIGIAGMCILAVVAAITAVVLGVFVIPDLKLSSEALRLATAGAIIAGIFMVVIFYVVIYVYEQSKLTLTDRSIVQMVQKGLFNRKTSRLSMSNVEDVNVEQRGLAAHIFNYGTLTVQTAGEEDNFVFSQCPNANVYAEQILEARQAYARHHTLDS